MGLFDELKGMAQAAEKAAEEHPEAVKSPLGELREEVVDTKTGGAHHDQVAAAEEKAATYIDEHATGPADRHPPR